MMEVAAAIQVAGVAFKGIKSVLEQGREIGETVEYFAQFYEAKDSILDKGIQNKEASRNFLRIFKGSSVEAEALRITEAKYKFAAMEKELREHLIYTGQSSFYYDMLRERRNIRQERTRQNIIKARRRAFLIDISCLVFLCSVLFSLIGLIIYFSP